MSTYLSLVEPAREDHDLIVRLLSLAGRFGDEPLRRRTVLALWKFPKDEASALRGIGELAALGVEAPRPTGADYLHRVKTLFRHRRFARIITELEAPGLPRWKDASEPARRMAGYYFASLLQKRAYAKAAAQIAKPAIQRRFGLDRRRTLLLALRIYLRRRHVGAAVKGLRELEALAPDEEKLPGYYLQLARLHRSKKNLPAMIAVCKQILEKYPTHPEAALAYWLPIWSYYERGDFERAGQWSELAMANTGGFGPETRSRYYYWQGRILLAQGRERAARETWDSLKRLWPTTYYGLMARNGGMETPQAPRFHPAPPAAPGRGAPPALKAIWDAPRLQGALFLFVVGEDERAAAMMGAEMGKPLGKGLIGELGAIFRYFDRFRLQYRITANYFSSDLKRRPVSDTPAWQNAYPRAFWQYVVEQTSQQRISPFFVLAVIREESNFHAAADSRSGAKGLMQLMPATAKMLAKRHRLPYEDGALTGPEFNITLGTLYLKSVLKRYKWNPILAAASYNAGPNAVRRWKKQFAGLSPDEFVESIPYDETRGYVKRVMSSYYIYKELYGGPGRG